MPESMLVQQDDYPALVAFLASFSGEDRPLEFWRDRIAHWWDNNPAFTENVDRGWVLRDGDSIVGFLGNVPTLFQTGDAVVTAYNATTWRVMPEHQRQSLELFFKMLTGARNTLVFDTTPSERAVEIIEALRFSLLPAVRQGRSFAFTSPGTLVRSVPVGRWIPMAVLRPAGKVLINLPRLRLKRNRNLDELNVMRLDHADSSFDELWTRTRNTVSNTNARTSDYVNWYCFSGKYFQKELFGCFRGGHLVGYLIAQNHQDHRFKPLKCLDLWTDSGDSSIAKALLLEAARFAGSHDCGFVALPHFSEGTRLVCDEIGMWHQRSFTAREYMKAGAAFPGSVTESDSYFVWAQGDYGL